MHSAHASAEWMPESVNGGAKAFKTDVALGDGSLAQVRPVRPDDQGLLLEFARSLSPETFGLRFTDAPTMEQAAKRLLSAPDQFALLAAREGMSSGTPSASSSPGGRPTPRLWLPTRTKGKGWARSCLASWLRQPSRRGSRCSNRMCRSRASP